MRFALTLATLAAVASSAAAGWLPPLLSPKVGDVYTVGDELTITWDTSAYNSTANSFGKFYLGYKGEDSSGNAVTTVAQFVGRAASFGSQYDLWTEGENSLTFTIDIPSSVPALGGDNWVIYEFGGDAPQFSGEFTVNKA
ncbi:hypothetical protein JCM8097_008163 [Rhodosporidiobolus ruineniae]